MNVGVYNWLSKSMGKEHIFKITFDIDFVADNLIDASFNAQAIDQVAFTDDQATTMALLAEKIQKTTVIMQCLVTGPRELTCQGKAKGQAVVVIGPDTQGGVTQPIATIEDIQEAVFVQVIRGHQTASRPAKPYAYFMINAETSYGLDDDYLGFDETGLLKRAGMRAVTVLVQCIGPDALQFIRDARRSLALQEIKDAFYYTYGMAVIETIAVQNLTGFLETDTEERGQLDVRFAHSENYLEDSTWIETVEIEGDIPPLHIEDVYPLT